MAVTMRPRAIVARLDNARVLQSYGCLQKVRLSCHQSFDVRSRIKYIPGNITYLTYNCNPGFFKVGARQHLSA